MLTAKSRLDIVKKYYSSLLGATAFENREGNVPHIGNSAIKDVIKINAFESKHNNFFIKREMNFTPDETELVNNISDEMSEIFASGFLKNYIRACLPQAQTIGVAKSISKQMYKIILEIINILEEFSSETYEGQKISFSIGLDGSSTSSSNKLINICKYDFARVLTSGHDSLLVCSKNGGVVAHISPLPACNSEEFFSPIKFLPIASWTTEDKYAFSLNRNGEILVFKNKNLTFAKRRGCWHYFSHGRYTTNLDTIPIFDVIDDTIVPMNVLKSIYVSMIDTSFQRKGACIGIIHRSSLPSGEVNEKLMDIISKEDILSRNIGEKAIFLNSIINGQKFQDLPRIFRQEILAMDGATIILEDGTIFAAGAIVKINGGSSGGGRRAAACALTKLGVGIKVSNDGKITVWHDPNHLENFDEIG